MDLTARSDPAATAPAGRAPCPPSPGLVAARDKLTAWLLDHAYPIWWRLGADRAHGGFHDRVDLEGTPKPGAKRARVAARQAYAYGLAGAMGWNGEAPDAMRHGLDFLETGHRRADGLYRAWATPVGEPDNDAVELYDQAFALLAMATASLHGDATAGERAAALLRRLPAHPLGGFSELDGGPLNANPNMHLFEAFIAWTQAGGGEAWRRLAADQARLATTRMIDPEVGVLWEYFDADWTRPADPARREAWPGHQFEWAWLLMRWGALSGDEAVMAPALRLIAVAESHGVDPARGVAINALDADLKVRDPAARLWPQTEWLKASALAAALTGESRYWVMAERAAAALWRYLEVSTPGLWRDVLAADGAFIHEAAPTSSFYHIVCAIHEIDRICG